MHADWRMARKSLAACDILSQGLLKMQILTLM
jgi:hypothetical protein